MKRVLIFAFSLFVALGTIPSGNTTIPSTASAQVGGGHVARCAARIDGIQNGWIAAPYVDSLEACTRVIRSCASANLYSVTNIHWYSDPQLVAGNPLIGCLDNGLVQGPVRPRSDPNYFPSTTRTESYLDNGRTYRQETRAGAWRSGAGEGWSELHTICSGPIPPPYRFRSIRTEVALEGDRRCGPHANCWIEQRNRNDICGYYQFQGFSERDNGHGHANASGLLIIYAELPSPPIETHRPDVPALLEGQACTAPSGENPFLEPEAAPVSQLPLGFGCVNGIVTPLPPVSGRTR